MTGVREHGRLPAPAFPAAVFTVLDLIATHRVSVDFFIQLVSAEVLGVGRVLDVLYTWRLVVLKAAERRKQQDYR